jgi:iron complex outermembrane recepter protein
MHSRSLIHLTTSLLFSTFCIAEPKQISQNLTEVSLEDLMNVEVTSVSKREQKLSQTAAAIHVITQEDIRRSGLTSIPELLRRVPGLHVGRIDGNKWAISARGFNSRFANKMLVLIDGRSVYTPFFSGVFWDVQDVMLEDVERIEVIRGPGATLWGANAVEGVVNIITKRAEDTQGGLVAGGFGNEEQGLGGIRYGGKIGAKAHYRVYGKHFSRSELVDSLGNPEADSWNMSRGGTRVDWNLSPQDSLTVQGDVYQGRMNETARPYVLFPPYTQEVRSQTPVSGGNVLSRWNHSFSKQSNLTFQMYYDRTNRDDDILIKEQRDTVDFDFQHQVALGPRHDFIWGGGYRVTRDAINNGTMVSMNPSSRRDGLFSSFVQDEIKLIPEELYLTVGSKFERNNYTGFEIQPNARLLWLPRPGHTLWTAISRAVRTPSRGEHDSRVIAGIFPGPGDLPIVATALGNRNFVAETLRAHEVGYRWEAKRRWSLDVATFFNVYDNIRSFEPGAPGLAGSAPLIYLQLPVLFDNKVFGETFGLEATANWQLTSRWRLTAGYTWLNAELHRRPGSLDTIASAEEGNSPRHQFQVHSYLKLWNRLELDNSFYRVGAINDKTIPGYNRLDARLGWRFTESLDLSLAAHNLLDPRHPEFGRFFWERTTEMKRAAYLKFTWQF